MILYCCYTHIWVQMLDSHNSESVIKIELCLTSYAGNKKGADFSDSQCSNVIIMQNHKIIQKVNGWKKMITC